MKRIILLPVFVFVIHFSTFSQEKANQLKNAPFVNLGPLLTGALNDGFGITLGYEIAPLKQLSVVNSVTFLQYYVDTGNKNTDILTVGYNLVGRLYPLSSAVDKLFLGVGFSYIFTYGEINEKKNGNIWCPVVESGWKFIFPMNFFTELSLAYKPKFSADVDTSKYGPNNPEPQRLEYGISLGWAF
jgi:hypothetical protein